MLSARVETAEGRNVDVNGEGDTDLGVIDEQLKLVRICEGEGEMYKKLGLAFRTRLFLRPTQALIPQHVHFTPSCAPFITILITIIKRIVKFPTPTTPQISQNAHVTHCRRRMLVLSHSPAISTVPTRICA
jgi:hypothetical protein